MLYQYIWVNNAGYRNKICPNPGMASPKQPAGVPNAGVDILD